MTDWGVRHKPLPGLGEAWRQTVVIAKPLFILSTTWRNDHGQGAVHSASAWCRLSSMSEII